VLAACKNIAFYPQIYFRANGPAIDSKIKCDDYSEFKSKDSRFHDVWGEDMPQYFKIPGVDNKYDIVSPMSSYGEMHLMLMPNRDGNNSLLTDYRTNRQSLIKSLNSTVKLLQKAYPNRNVIILESGSNEEMKTKNQCGIIPAHIHFIIPPKNSNLDFDRFKSALKKKFEDSEQWQCDFEKNTTTLKNSDFNQIYSSINRNMGNGDFPYGLNAVIKPNGKIDAVVFIKDQPYKINPPFVTYKLLTEELYGRTDPEYYNWKALVSSSDRTPKQKQRIAECREGLQNFLSIVDAEIQGETAIIK